MSDQDKIDGILASPLFLKLMAAAAALALWFYVSGSGTTEAVRTLLIPIEYLNAPPQTMIKAPVKEVEIVLSGASRVLSSITNEGVACEADLRGLGEGKYRVPVRTIVPNDIKVMDVKPTHVDIELARLIDRLAPVEIAVEKGLPPDLFLDSVEIIPKNVSIKGSEKDLAKIDVVRITPTLDELKAGGELMLPVEAVKSAEFDDQVTIEPEKVKLSAVLARGVPKKNVPVNARIIGEPGGDYKLKAVIVEPAVVTVEGPLSKLAAVTKVDTETIDLTGISREQNMVVPLRSPEDPLVDLVGVTSVRVDVLLSPFTVTRLLSRLKVQIEGRSVYPGWKAEPDFVNVLVEGAPSEIGSLDEKDVVIRPFVNVTNIVSRRLTVPVQIQNKSGGKLKVLKVDPASVSVIAEVN